MSVTFADALSAKGIALSLAGKLNKLSENLSLDLVTEFDADVIYERIGKALKVMERTYKAYSAKVKIRTQATEAGQ